MADGNGRNKPDGNGQLQDPKTGRFVPGNPGGPGRPKGATLDFMCICRKKAKEFGVDLEDLVWRFVQGLSERAMSGDPAAGKLLLDRFCGILEKGAQVNVGVGIDARSTGPPIPSPQELGKCLRELADESLKLLQEGENDDDA